MSTAVASVVVLVVIIYLILGLHVLDQVDDTVGVTELVVVPGNELNELVVKGDTGLGVEHRRVSVAKEVGGDNLLIGVAENALQWTVGSLLNLGLNLIVAGALAQTDSQIDNGHIGCGHTESHAGKLAVQSRNNLADGLGGTSGCWNDVLGSTTTITPQFARWAIDGLLGGRGGVDSGHQTLNDLKVIVDNLSQGSQAVGGARGVRHNLHVGAVGIQIDTAHEHGGIGRWSRDDDLLGTTLQVSGGLLGGGEHTGRLNHVLSASAGPVDVGGVALAENGDLLAIDDQETALSGNGALETAVSGVELEQVDHVLDIDEWIVNLQMENTNTYTVKIYNSSKWKIFFRLFLHKINFTYGNDGGALVDGGAQHQTTDAAKSVNTNFRHIFFFFFFFA